MSEEEFYHEENNKTLSFDLKAKDVQSVSLKKKLEPYNEFDLIVECHFGLGQWSTEVFELSNEHGTIDLTEIEERYLLDELFFNEIGEQI